MITVRDVKEYLSGLPDSMPVMMRVSIFSEGDQYVVPEIEAITKEGIKDMLEVDTLYDFHPEVLGKNWGYDKLWNEDYVKDLRPEVRITATKYLVIGNG